MTYQKTINLIEYNTLYILNTMPHYKLPYDASLFDNWSDYEKFISARRKLLYAKIKENKAMINRIRATEFKEGELDDLDPFHICLHVDKKFGIKLFDRYSMVYGGWLRECSVISK